VRNCYNAPTAQTAELQAQENSCRTFDKKKRYLGIIRRFGEFSLKIDG
jgi:hypothetical protein